MSLKWSLWCCNRMFSPLFGPWINGGQTNIPLGTHFWLLQKGRSQCRVRNKWDNQCLLWKTALCCSRGWSVWGLWLCWSSVTKDEVTLLWGVLPSTGLLKVWNQTSWTSAAEFWKGRFWPLCFSSQLPKVKIRLYADDTVIYTTVSSMVLLWMSSRELSSCFHFLSSLFL